MKPTGTYLAVFIGGKTSAKMAEWNALQETERKAREQKGMRSWQEWAQKHQGAIVTLGGPLGKTKRIAENGVEDIANNLSAFTIVRAESPETAAKLFENHPHFAIFPGDSVEVMPILEIPGA